MSKNLFEKQESLIKKQKEEEFNKKKQIELDLKSQNKSSQEKIIDEQTKEIISKDLDELIKIENGNDVEYEFYFEGNIINTSQSIFEIIKDY